MKRISGTEGINRDDDRLSARHPALNKGQIDYSIQGTLNATKAASREGDACRLRREKSRITLPMCRYGPII
jgi:hypothetical protein